MFYMYLYILFNNDKIEKHVIKNFSDLSQTKSRFYYYEEPNDMIGKGKTFLREEISCFEISAFPLEIWEKHLREKGKIDQ